MNPASHLNFAMGYPLNNTFQSELARAEEQRLISRRMGNQVVLGGTPPRRTRTKRINQEIKALRGRLAGKPSYRQRQASARHDTAGWPRRARR